MSALLYLQNKVAGTSSGPGQLVKVPVFAELCMLARVH